MADELSEWRRLRDEAGELLYLVVRARRLGVGREAEETYREWLADRISYRDARERLERLLEAAADRAKAAQYRMYIDR